MAVRILVVDDDRAVRESLRRSLAFNGYSVELAQDGREALDLIANDRPDALVLDVMMPRLDGLEVCRQLRSTGDDLPILVLTARDSVSERVAGLDAGADDYLPKPFALEELLARMRALLRRTTPDDIQSGPCPRSALAAVEIDQAEAGGLEQAPRHLVLLTGDGNADELGTLGLPLRAPATGIRARHPALGHSHDEASPLEGYCRAELRRRQLLFRIAGDLRSLQNSEVAWRDTTGTR